MVRANLPRNRSQTGAEAIKDNNLYAANLSSALRGLGKRVIAAYSASLLDRVISETKHDSSRFAANWNLVFNRVGMRETMDPKRYREAVETGGTIGARYNLGQYKETVRKAKAMFYGYTGAGGGLKIPTENGMLHTVLAIGRPGTVPRIELVNPAISAEHPRKDGYGRTYAQNALEGAPGIAAGVADELSQIIKSSFIPAEIVRYRGLIRTAQAAKVLFKE